MFRNGNKGHAFRPHDHLTALDGGNFILGNDKQRINFDEVFLLLIEPVEQLLAGRGQRILGLALVAGTKERIKVLCRNIACARSWLT